MIEPDPADTFRQEAAELLDSLEAALLDLSDAPHNRELIDTAFRALHTIKGSGAMFGFDQVAAFTHEFETAFDLLRKGRIEANADIISIALGAKDHIRTLIENPAATDTVIGEAILDDLRRNLSGLGEVPVVVTAAHPLAPAPDCSEWTIHIAFEPEILRNGTNPLALLDDLRALGSCRVTADTSKIPHLDALDPVSCLIAWDIALAGECTAAEIEDVFLFVRDEMTLKISPASSPEDSDVPPPPEEPALKRAPPLKKPSEPGRRAEDQRPANTVRVQASRLDQLMDRVGELVIAQARLSQLAHTGSDPAIKSIAEEIERLASGLRDTTMGVRMVPMGALFGRFRRLVHDVSRDLSKEVEFVTLGEDTELDKTMIERLADPLVHLIRNAIDHGLESADARAATGKAAAGRIELAARYVGAQVFVTVSDDGAGLNTARIRAKAEEQALVAPGVALTDQETYQFLFAPGFSTASKISALSGRGVGMDVVKRTIEGMRGSIDIETTPGYGTSVTLRLPLTLAIIEGLLVRVNEGRFIIPLSAVEECIEMHPTEDRRSGNRNFLNVRGQLVPFLRLREMFGEQGAADPHQKIIISRSGEMRVGLVVDQIIGSHQTVIKSLSKMHADVATFSGATILGDGTAALILDVAQLIALGQSRPDGTWPEAA